MSLYLPPEMHWLGWVAGAEWPDGDEDKAWAVSEVWKEAAEELLALIAAVDTAKAATMAAYSDGAARAEMGALYDQMRSGESSIEALAAFMQQTSDSTFDMGTELQAEKITIIVTLCWLAVEIALAWLFPPTAPAVEAAAIGTSRAILQSVRTATQRAIQQLAAKLGAPTVKRSFWRSLLAGKPTLPTAKGWGVVGSEVIQGAAEEAIISGAIQAGQLADDKRREMDWSEIGYSAAAGGFAEPIGGAVAKGLNNGFANGFGLANLVGQLDNWWGRAGQNTVVGAASDGLAGIAGSLFVAGISGQSIEDSLTGIGVAGGFIQGGLVGLADPSTFGRGGFAGAAGGDWGAGAGDRFGRSGAGFDNGSGDGSVPGEQVGQPPPPGTGEDPGNGDSRQTRGDTAERTDQPRPQRSEGSRGGPGERAELSRPGSPGPTQPQSFAGGQLPAGEGPPVPARSPGAESTGNGTYSTPGGPFTAGDSSPSLSATGGQSPPSTSGTAGGPSHGSQTPAGNGVTPGGPGSNTGEQQGNTPTTPGAGGEGGAAGSNNTESSGPNGGDSVAGEGAGHGDGRSGSAGGEGARGPDGPGAAPGTGPGPQTGDSVSTTGDEVTDATTRQDPQTHRDQPDAPGRSEVPDGDRPETSGQDSDETGSRPGEASTGSGTGRETGDRIGDTAPPAAPSYQASGLPGAPAGGSVQAPGVPQTPGPAQAAGGPAANSGPVQSAGPGQHTAHPGRTETPAGQSSSAARPITPAGAANAATALPDAQQHRQAPSPLTTAQDPIPDTVSPEPPRSVSPEEVDETVWADLVDGDFTEAPESTWTPQAFESVFSVAANPGAIGPNPVPTPGAPAPAQNSPVLPAQNPSSPAQNSNSPAPIPHPPGAPTQNPGSPGTSNQVQAGVPQGDATASPESDTGRAKRARSEVSSDSEAPAKRVRAGQAAPGTSRQGDQEAGSADVQPVPVLVPLDSGPQQQPPAQQTSRTSGPPRDSEAEQSDEDSDWDGWTDPEPDTAPERPLLGRPAPPMVLGNPAHSRVFGPGLLAPLENPQLQRNLEDALRGPDGDFVRYADPRTHPAGGTPYGRLVNPDTSDGALRGNNCAEAALAGLAGFYGVPTVAAPRFPDVVDGVVDRRGGEQGSPQRVFQMLRTGQDGYNDGRPIPDQYAAMDAWIRHLGPGSAAYVTSLWRQIDPTTGQPYPDDGSVTFEAHTTLIVYPEGAEGPVWWDPQSGEMTLGPSPEMVGRSAGVAFIPIPEGRGIAADPDPGTALPAPVPYQPPAEPVLVPTAQSAAPPPSPLPDPATSRTFGPGRLNPDLHPGLQQVLETALSDGSGGFVAGAHPGTYPSVAMPYGLLVNAGGPATPGRRSNDFDAALSALSSFLGRPRVAAARFSGTVVSPDETTAEIDGVQRALRWAGGNLHLFPDGESMAQQYAGLHDWVHRLGPGSAALVFRVVPVRDPATGAVLRDTQDNPRSRVDPLVVVYPPSAPGPVWWNAVTGETWDAPPDELVTNTGELRFIPIPPGHPIESTPPTSPAASSGHLASDGSPAPEDSPTREPEQDSDAEGPGHDGSDWAGWTDPESDAERDAEAESAAESEPESDAEADPESDADAEPDADADAESDADAERDVESGSEADPAPESLPHSPPAPPIAARTPVPDPPIFGRPAPPMVLGNPMHSRVYGPGLLAPLEDPQLQHDIEDALRDADGNFVRYADPRTHPAGGTPYGRLVNPDMPGALRGNNCGEAALAGLASFYGVPMAAAPVYPNVVNGVVDRRAGERGNWQRVGQVLRTYLDGYGDGRSIPEQFAAMDEWIRHLGPGSAAYVTNYWRSVDPATGLPFPEGSDSPATYPHATLIVYPEGAEGPVWWDPQSGEMTLGPPPRMVHNTESVFFAPIPPGRVIAADPGPTVALPAPVPYQAPAGPVVVPTAQSTAQPPAQLPDPAASRRFGPGYLDPSLHPGLQQVLENSLRDGSGGFVAGAHPGTYPSAEAPYGAQINPGGPGTPGRSSNHFDAALAAVSTFLGRPRVALSRHIDSVVSPDNSTDETDGFRRAAQWAGGNLHQFPGGDPMAQQYANLHNWLHGLGPGSAAVVFSVIPERDPTTGQILRDAQNKPKARVMPMVVVYPPAAAGPVWWNAVTGETWDQPPADLVAVTARLGFVPIPPGRTVAEAAGPMPSAGSAAQPPAPGPAGGGTRSLPEPAGTPYHLRERTRRFINRALRPTPVPAAPTAIEYTPIPEVVQAPEPATRPGPMQNPETSRAAASTETRPDRSPGLDEGYLGPDGYRQFSSDEAGGRYGENRLGGEFHRLTPAQQTAVRKYVAESFTVNNVLRDGAPDREPFFTRVRDSGPTLATLYELTGDELPTRAGLERIARHPDLTPGQRAVVDRALAEPDLDAFVEQLTADQDTLSRLTAYLGTTPSQAAFDRRITDLNTALDRPIPGGPVRAVRGVNDISFLIAPDGSPLGGRDPRLLAGTTQREPAYLSSSLGVVPAFPGTIRIELDLPEGTHGLWLGRNGRYGYERELLLPSGTRYEITEVVANPDGDYGNIRPEYLIRARVLPPAGAAGTSSRAEHGDSQYAPVDGNRPADSRVDTESGGLIPVQSRAAESGGLIPVQAQAAEAGGLIAVPPQAAESNGLIPVPSGDQVVAEPNGLIPAMSRDPVDGESNGLIPADPTTTTEDTAGPIPAETSRSEQTRQSAEHAQHMPAGAESRDELSGRGSRQELPGDGLRQELPGAEMRHELPGDGLRHELPAGEQRQELPAGEQRQELPAGEQRQELPAPETVPEQPPAEEFTAGGRTTGTPTDRFQGSGPMEMHGFITELDQSDSRAGDQRSGGRAGGDRPRTPADLGLRTGEPSDIPVGAPPDEAPAAKRQRLDEPVAEPSATGETHTAETSAGEPDPDARPPGSQQDIAPRPRLDRPWPPMVLANGSDARAYGPGWLAPLEDPALQTHLENTMRDADGNFVRYADPRSFPAHGTPYGELINPGGTAAPGRNKNCLDCSVAGLMTFLGRPSVALPRFTRIVNGVADTGGSDGLDQTRLQEMLGNHYNDFADGSRTITEQFLAIHEYVKNLGPGSAAYVSFHWQPTDPRTGRGMQYNGRPVLSGHGTLVVYPVGAKGPVWWDPQGNITTEKPSLRLVHSTRWVGFIPVPPGRSVQESFAAAGPVRPEPGAPAPSQEAVLAPEHERPEPPQRLADPAAGRRFGPGELRAVEHPGFQKALEDALLGEDGNFVVGADPRTYPRPERPYGKLVNPGAGVLPGRDTNRFDAALSGLATFLGKPEVAARRQADPAVPGNERADERNGLTRAAQWLGSEPTRFAPALPMHEQYTALHKWVGFLGPGSAALVLSAKPAVDPQTGAPLRTPDGKIVAGEPEPSLVVYPRNGSGPVWWDPLTGKTSLSPPHALVGETAALTFVPIPPGRTIGTEPAAPATEPGTENAAQSRQPPPNAGSDLIAQGWFPSSATDRATAYPDLPSSEFVSPVDPAGTPLPLRRRFQAWRDAGSRHPDSEFGDRSQPDETQPVDPPRDRPSEPGAAYPDSQVESFVPSSPPPPRDGHRPPPGQVENPVATRIFGPGQLAPPESPAAQAALERALRGPDGEFARYADPRTAVGGDRPYGELINAGGPTEPGRSTNCTDCVLSGLSTFLGAPLVAAATHHDVVDGVVRTGAELHASHRAEHMFRTAFDSYDYGGRSIAEQFDALEAWITHLGPGSAAFVANVWQPADPGTGAPRTGGASRAAASHAVALVYPVGAQRPLWWDPQTGETSERPLHGMDLRSRKLTFLVIPPGRTVLDAPVAADRPPLPAPMPRHTPAIRPRQRRPAALLLADPATTRTFGPHHLHPVEHPGLQRILEDSLRARDGRFVVGADPRTYPAPELPYGALVNGGGPINPLRRYNKVDAAISAVSSFFGQPRVAVPRYPDPGLGQNFHDDERGGLQRLTRWARTKPSRFGSEIGPPPAHFAALHEWVRGLGPGAAAVAIIDHGTADPVTGVLRPTRVHETDLVVVVYPVDAAGPVWWNPVTGEMWDRPPVQAFPRAVEFGFLEFPPGRVIGTDPAHPDSGPLIAPNLDPPEPPIHLANPAAGRDAFFGPIDVQAQRLLTTAMRGDHGVALAGADPRTHPTPRHPYRSLIGNTDPQAPGYGLNKFDAAIAAVSAFLGTPQVSAPRDPAAGSDELDTGAGDGIDRLLAWSGTELNDFTAGSMPEQFAALHDWVQDLGPGSAAVAIGIEVAVDPATGTFDRTRDENDLDIAGVAVLVVVYPHTSPEPVWWNPVTGEAWDAPPPDLPERTLYLNFVAIPPGRTVAADTSDLAGSEPGTSDTDTEGATDESAATDRGSGAGLPGSGAPGRARVSDRPDAGGRLVTPTGPDSGGRGDGRGDRDVVSGGERGHRRDPAVSELVGLGGDGRLHRSGDREPEAVRPADLSAADPDRTTPDRGEPGSHRIPGGRPLGAETTGAVLDGDRQENPATAADDQRRDGRRGLGGVAAGTGRGVAGDGRYGVLNPASPPPPAAPRYTAEQLALIPQPAHDRNPARWGRLEADRHQVALEAAVSDGAGGFVQFAHPATAAPGGRPLIELINGPGPGVLGRDDNCEDCVLSLLATFLGKPQVAAPAIGPHERDMGNRGQARAERLLGSHLVRYDDGTRTIEEQYRLAHDRIAALGPGAMAFVVVIWQGRDDNGNPRPGGSHSFAVVFPDGAAGPVWCDPQVGRTADEPIAEYVRETAMVGFVISTPQRVLAAAGTRADLESALTDGAGGFVKFADPRPYRQLVTDKQIRTAGRISVYRAGIAGIASFLGSPRFAAPAWNDLEADGGPRALDRLHEEGRTEVEHFFGKSMRTLDDGRRTITRQLDLIYQRVADLGPESVALVEVSHRRSGGVVADECLLLVYPSAPSAPVWWDPVKGATYRHATVTMLLGEPATDSILYITATAGDLIAGNLSALLAAPAHYGFAGSIGPDPQTWAAGASPDHSAHPADTSPAHPAPGPASLPAPAPSAAITESALERAPGRWGELESYQFQLDLETAISDDDDNFVAFRHPGDESVPGGYPYIELINGPGMAAPGRSENCEDCVAALLSTFLGKPQVALPAIGPPGRDRGSHGIRKAERLLGSQVMSFGWDGQSIAEQYRAAHDRIAELGPGTMADVSIQWHDVDENGNKRYNPDGTPVPGDQHAIAVVYPEGAAGPVWCDPQSGRTYDYPPPTMIDSTLGVAFVISTPERVVQAAEHRAKLTAALDDGAGGSTAFRHPGSYKQLITYDRFDPARCQHSIYRVGIAATATFLGRPRFAVPSRHDLNPGGRPSVPEVLDSGGRRDVAEFFQGPLQALQPADAPMSEQLGFLHQLIQQPEYGPGSVIFVELTHKYEFPGIGTSEAADQCLLLVYPDDGSVPSEPVWWDPLVGAVYSHDRLISTVATEAVGMRFAAATSDTLINGNFTPTPHGSAAGSPSGPLIARSRARSEGGPPGAPEQEGAAAPEQEALAGPEQAAVAGAEQVGAAGSAQVAVAGAEQLDAAAEGEDGSVGIRPPRYRGHGRIQRRRPIEWVLPTGFRPPDAPESWLPPGAVPAGQPGNDHLGGGKTPEAGELPEVDIPFTLGTDTGPA